MSKNFKPEYEVNFVDNDVDDLYSLNLAEIAGKLNASKLSTEDISVLTNDVIMNILDHYNAEAIVVDKDGNAYVVTSDDIDKQLTKLVGDIADMVPKIFKKKEPWYKRLWHKIFPKKNK